VNHRLKACGERTGVHVSAHRLRHTYATQLVNAGCRITSLQKLLGHERLNSTMIYAKVYDATVEQDYFTAMANIEKRIVLNNSTITCYFDKGTVLADVQAQMLDLISKITDQKLNYSENIELFQQLRQLINVLCIGERQ
jgi:hypothetical protein